MNSRKYVLIRKENIYITIAILASIVAIVRIYTSYNYISQTFDETDHLACGMQYLDRGEYVYEPLHPPVSRLFIATLPYLDGARSHGDSNQWIEGNDILFHQHTYWRTLTLARIGVLPFFLIALVSIWLWSKQLYGDRVACFAVILFSLLPPVLAHAGLATTDIPLTAMFLLSSLVFWNWLIRPSVLRSIGLGIVVGTSCATKFSFLTFFPLAALAMIFIHVQFDWKKAIARIISRQALQFGSIAALTVFITFWAWYRFSFGPMLLPNQLAHGTRTLNAHHIHGFPESALLWIFRFQVPAPEFFHGIAFLTTLRSSIYLLGHPLMKKSSPWFFPLAIAVKTPIAFLLLLVILIGFLLKRNSWRSNEFLPLAIAIILFGFCIMSPINLGSRHILPIYGILGIAAALGAEQLLTSKKPYGLILLAILVIWMGVSSFRYGRDQIAYFNEFASSHSEYFLLDSDLDWGQDLDKMVDTLHRRNITSVNVSYWGSANLYQHGFPQFDTLQPYTHPTTPWVVISKTNLYEDSGYAWLRQQMPTARVGNSMLLYHIP